MYIISKKKDYYDGVVGTMGIDKTIVYDREIKILDDYYEFPKEFQPNRTYNIRWKNQFLNLNSHSAYKNSKYPEYSSFIVGFCGKLYMGWKLYRENNNLPFPDLITDITYDYELLKKYIKSVGWGCNLDDDTEYVKTYNPIQIFRDLKSPIFIYDSDYNRTSINRHRTNSRFIVNPILNEYKFYTVIDSFTAFQEIQMFMGGVLGAGEKEIVEVADKYKIGQHGFDKWSFRREPENRNI